jgi:hypothetical protein
MASTLAIISLLFLLLVPGDSWAVPRPIAGGDSDEAGAVATADRSESNPAGDPGAPQPSPKKNGASNKAEDWTVVIYPILVWAPVMGGSVSMPDLPAEPGQPEGGVQGGDVTGGLSGAFFGGFAIQKSWFVADVSALWANFDSSGTRPQITLDTDLVFYDASAGVKVTRDLAITGGVRHLGLNMDATLGDRPTVTWKPSVTDPMVGVQWRPSLSEHWGLDVGVKGGGFGVGSDIDVSATGRLDWRFTRHFGLTAGYGVIHFKLSRDFTTPLGTFSRETTQTLHGPIFGLGIYF